MNSYDAPAKELLVAGPVTTIIRWERTVTDAIYILEELTQVTCMFLLHSILLTTDSILCSFLVRQSLKRLFIIHKCFLIIKTNEMHYFANLFWYRTLHVSDRFTVHHQESSTVHTATGICHTGYADCLLARSGWNSS